MLNNQAYMIPLNGTPQMVKKNPDIARSLLSFIIWTISSFIWIGLIGLDLLLIYRNHGPTFLLPMHMFISLMSTVDAVLMFVNWRVLKKLEIKRQRAAAGDQRYILDQQPQIIETELNQAFPMIIEYRCNWRKCAALAGTIILLFAILLGIYIIITPFLFSDWIFAGIVFAGFIVFIVLVVGILLAATYGRFKYKVILAAEGFYIERNSGLKGIAWQDIRLFAIDAVPGTKKHIDPIQYELSSANEILKWQWVRPARRWFPIVNLSKPAIAQEEYNIQMQIALAIIRQQTGLPLQDLRDHAQK